jgi:hypothetical protein
MLELTPEQILVLERLRVAGFGLAAFPLYASYVAVTRGVCAALLAPLAGGGMQLYGEPCYLIAGQMGVRTRRGGRDCFVWKKEQVEATPERLAELRRFAEDVNTVLRA